MAENNQGGKEGSSPSTEEFQKLQESVANLTKGIASYRDETQEANKRAESAEKIAKELQEVLDATKEDDVNITKEDQEKLDTWAKKQGYVTKGELETERLKISQDSYKQIESQAVSEFLEKHSEYDNDENWSKLKAEFSQYKTPDNLQGYRNILNKIHKDLNGDSKIEDAKAAAKAELINKGRLSLGGGSQKGSSDEQTIENLQKRYPNLSKEQILERKAQIDALYPKT